MDDRMHGTHLGPFKPGSNELQRPSNQASSIYGIPPELLLEILLLDIGVDIGVWESSKRDLVKDLQRVVQLASVSFAWHEVIHHCPQMWTGIHGDMSDEKITLLLSKSKQAPLIIECNKLEASFWGLIKPHFDRWRSFGCRRDSAVLPEAAEFFSRQPAPMLEKFVLPETYQLSHLPPSCLFNNSAPRVRYLCSPSLPLSLNSSVFSRLTFLVIPASQAVSYEEQCLDYSTLFASLCPALGCLVINGKDAPFSSFPLLHFQATEKTFHFPHLSVLGLERLPSHIVGFILSSLQAPSSAIVGIDNAVTREIRDPFEVILPIRPTDSSMLLSSMLQTQKLKITHSNLYFRFCGKTIIPHYFDGKVFNGRRKSVDISFLGEVASAARLYAAICSSFCLRQLVELTFEGNMFFEDEGSMNLLYHLDTMQRLELIGCAQNVRKFLEGLASSHPNEVEPSSLPCKNLRTIGLYSVKGCHIQDLIRFMTTRYPSDGGMLPNDVAQLESLKIQGGFGKEEISSLRDVMGNCILNNIV